MIILVNWLRERLICRNLFYRAGFITEENKSPNCPKCACEYTYIAHEKYICPECSYEWNIKESLLSEEVEDLVTDANGIALVDGDTVVVIKDLKVKGSSLVVKVGTKVKNIRIVGGDHDIDCKIPSIGAMSLKSEFVRKV